MNRVGQLQESLLSMGESTRSLLAATATGQQDVFRFFMLVPQPQSWMQKAKPSNWLSKPMLLMPICGESFQPVGSGFGIRRPKDWVKKHPLLVKMSVIALQILVKVAATQVIVDCTIARHGGDACAVQTSLL